MLSCEASFVFCHWPLRLDGESINKRQYYCHCITVDYNVNSIHSLNNLPHRTSISTNAFQSIHQRMEQVHPPRSSPAPSFTRSGVMNTHTHGLLMEAWSTSTCGAHSLTKGLAPPTATGTGGLATMEPSKERRRERA